MELTTDIIKAINAVETQTKHKHYDHTVQLAKDYKALITGEKDLLKGYLRVLKKRETEGDRKERLELSEFINKAVGEQLTKTLRKLMRLSNVHASITYDRGAEKLKGTEVVELMERFERISEDGDVMGYIEDDLLMQSIVDPNSFIVLDKFEENGIELPYATDIPSKNIFNFKYRYRVLQMLTVETSFTGEKGKDLNKYHIYTPDHILVLTQKEKNQTVKEFSYEEIVNGEIINLDNKFYEVELYETNMGCVPAFRIGFKPDLRTDRETKESFIDPAVTYLKKLVGAVSEFDLANLKHAFPRLFGYERKCPGIPNEGKHCDGGKLKIGGGDCTVCNGRGILVPESSMDSITLPLPKDPADLHDLAKLSHTEGTDIELLEYMKKTILDYVQDAEKSIYGVITLGKDEVTKTATEKILQQEVISDSLEPFAKAISKWWKATHLIGAKLLTMDKGIIIEHQYPRNLRIQSVGEMIEEIKVLKDSGADSIFLEAVQDEIAEKRFVDKPSLLHKYRVYREHKPFNGATEQSIQYKIANNLVRKEDAILWANFIDIIEEIEYEQNEKNKEFVDLPKGERNALIEEKLKKYVTDLTTTPEIDFGDEENV